MDAAGSDLGRLDPYLHLDHPLKRRGLSDDAIQQVMACAMERAALRERIGAQEEQIPIPRSAGG